MQRLIFYERVDLNGEKINIEGFLTCICETPYLALDQLNIL